jgi:hypothetical protein
MQQTCSRCGGLLAPGATTCTYCGTPVASAYSQQNYPPPQTQYGAYPQGGTASTDPYAAQYSTQAAPPPPPMAPSGPYGQSAYGGSQPPYGAGQSAYGGAQPGYGGTPPATAFGAPVQPPPTSLPPQAGPFIPSQPPTPKKKSSATTIGIILAVVIVLAGLGVGGYVLFGKSGSGPNAQATHTSSPTAIPALYQDNLTNKDKHGNWDCSVTGLHCSFRADGYHIQTPDDFVYNAVLTQVFDNVQINVKGIISVGATNGKDTAALGIVFRVPQSNKAEGYNLLVFADGTYELLKWDKDGNGTALLDVTSSSAIHTGLNQENDLKLVVAGNQFTIYINDQKVNSATDATYANGGYVGLSATGKGAETIYSDLIITKPQS